MQKRTQLTLLLENRVGALAEIVGALAAAGANVDAISISDGTHHGVVRIVPAEPDPARQALRAAGIAFFEQEVRALLLPDRPGALAEACAALAAQGVNVDFVYGSACTCRGGCESLLVLAGSTPAAHSEPSPARGRHEAKGGKGAEAKHDGRRKRKKGKQHARHKRDKKRKA